MPSKRKSNSKSSSSSKRKKNSADPVQNGHLEAAAGVVNEETVSSSPSSARKNAPRQQKSEDSECRFLGDPVPLEEAKQRWPHRYSEKDNKRRRSVGASSEDSDEPIQARLHYLQAEVDKSMIFNLYDDAHVQAEDGQLHYICKITEFFEGVDGGLYFRAQWFYRPNDTVIQNSTAFLESKRVFFSEITNDNPLDCLVEKLKIVKISPNLDRATKEKAIPDCDYYYDMMYLLPYSTFIKPPPDAAGASSESASTISSDIEADADGGIKSDSEEICLGKETQSSEVKLLDLYSGCGAMSTGLCLGANINGVNLVNRWAVDYNEYACESLKLNHPETQARNEKVGDFLSLLKEWEKMCASFSLLKSENTHEQINAIIKEDEEDDEDDDDGQEDSADDGEVFEVEKFLAICYGDPKQNNKPGLYFKVRWRGYGPSEDTWEPLDGLSGCRKSIEEFVSSGYKAKILPLPGDVDVICGGPPCQGISGFNRFRNKENPLADPQNEQLKVFMDVVDYLKPRYVLMENVVDIVKFAKGFLGRYAIGRLVDMNYQARMGMMAAGAYGLPQFRMRVFVWGARPTEKLPQYPLPTHDLVLRGVIPLEFEMNTVAYEEGHKVELENKLFLVDAISDLPEVPNDEPRDEMLYGGPPQTEFQRFIRLTKYAMLRPSTADSESLLSTLFDHRPLQLNEDDFQRVCQIPKRKGANFRDLPGVRVRSDNKVEWDPDVERVKLPSGKPLVPDYAMSFVDGTSSKPFGRLWWDETVPTVVTRAEPHNQVLLHPLQDRVLTIRENARLQGFPDYYQLKGPIKQRYMQVGNAVAVPVARALGFALAMASQGTCGEGPLFPLPSKFPNIQERQPSVSVEDKP